MNEGKFLKCIVDDNRRQILNCLGDSEICVNEIIKLTNLEQTLVSFHLRTLRSCGLVKSRREGKKIMYKISNQRIINLLDSIKELSTETKELRKCGECE